MLKKLTSSEELSSIIKEGTWLVDFSATWCGPCRMLEPVLEEYGKNNNVVQIDTDEFPDLAREFGVMSIPTLIAFNNGKELNKSIGYVDISKIEEMFK